MPIIRLVPVFEKSRDKFVKKDLKLAIKIRHTLERFATNPQHPSLHLEKLSGTDVWTIRIDRGNRLFFTWSSDGDIAIFFLVGKHDLYRNL